MPYYVVKVEEVITHEFIVKARDREQVETMDVDVFADMCAANEGFSSVESRSPMIEDIEQTLAIEDDVHLDITED